MTILETARLRLEPMADLHLDGLYAMNRDPDVMRYITGQPETRKATLAMIRRVERRWETWGFGWWSLFEKQSGQLIGAAGIQYLGLDPANRHEIGWRLRRDKWGQGFASEAARRIASFAFDQLGAPVLCAICHPDNLDSSRLMQKLGMVYQGQEEWHGAMVSVHQVTADEWRAANPA
jgi:RimJ/RimL family protein N-acetyltransferase